MYVIKNQGRYVTWPGCPSSFTYRLEAARKFDSKDAAEREKCGNETWSQSTTSWRE